MHKSERFLLKASVNVYVCQPFTGALSRPVMSAHRMIYLLVENDAAA